MYESKLASVFKESAVTLRHKRACTYTFSRATRFRSQKRADASEYVLLPSTLDSRGTTQGFGERWSPGNTNGLASPAPGSYNLPSTLNTRSGPRYTKNSPLRTREQFDHTPGPGTYECAQPIGKHAPKFSFRPRILKVMCADSPPPDAYSPTPILNAAFKNITFGIGERNYLRPVRDPSPGPGTYEIKTSFAVRRKTENL